MRLIYPVALLSVGLLIMIAGATIVFYGGFRGMWTLVAITIAVGFVTANFGRVALIDSDSRSDRMLRCAICAVVHLSFALMLVFFIGGGIRDGVGAGSDALGIAGLILPVSLLCVALNLGRLAVLHREGAAHQDGPLGYR